MKRVDVVIAIVVREGRVLICQRRKNDTFAEYWEFPGGKREPSETPTRCLHRELQEELAIKVELIEELTPIEHDYSTVSVQLLPYLCRLESGEPRPLASQQLAWVEPARLRDYRFPEANAPLLEQIITRLSAISSSLAP